MTVPASLAEDAGKDGPDDGRSGSALFFVGGRLFGHTLMEE